MEEKNKKTDTLQEKDLFPRYYFEAIMHRQHKTICLLVWIIIALIFALIFQNCLYTYERMSYDVASVETVTVDGKTGTANYIGNDGDIHNGESSSSESPSETLEKP